MCQLWRSNSKNIQYKKQVKRDFFTAEVLAKKRSQNDQFWLRFFLWVVRDRMSCSKKEG
jgi:hypothetical protein